MPWALSCPVPTLLVINRTKGGVNLEPFNIGNIHISTASSKGQLCDYFSVDLTKELPVSGSECHSPRPPLVNCLRAKGFTLSPSTSVLPLHLQEGPWAASRHEAGTGSTPASGRQALLGACTGASAEPTNATHLSPQGGMIGPAQRGTISGEHGETGFGHLEASIFCVIL